MLAILPTLGLKAPRLTMTAIHLTELTGIVARYALPLLTILLCGIVACSSYSLFPIYGRALGLSEREAACGWLLFGFGAVACQYAIGWLCDRWQHDIVHRALIGLVTAGLLLLPALDSGGPLLWLFGFFFGGAVTGLYTVTMYLSGSTARPGELLPLIMAVTLFYTLGSIAGPVMAGWAMEILPPHGLPVSLAAASLLVIAAMFLLQRRPAQQRRIARQPAAMTNSARFIPRGAHEGAHQLGRGPDIHGRIRQRAYDRPGPRRNARRRQQAHQPDGAGPDGGRRLHRL